MTKFWYKLKKIFSLSLILARANFKLRNEGTYLGLLWYLLNPLLTFALLFLIFFDRLGENIKNYPVYLLLGIIIFNLFHKTTTESSQIIINNSYLIKSINFPREALVLSIIFKNLFAHIFEIIIFLIFLIISKISLIGIIFYLPILLLFSLFIFGICLFLASVTVYFFDLEYIWGFGSYLLWFATPIFYAIEGQQRLFILNLFNPLYYFITAARDIIIYAQIPSLWLIGGMLGYTLLSLIIGVTVFRKLKHKFAELI